MSDEREITCIICPNGCRMRVLFDPKEIREVKHALCPKGWDYARDEIFHPVRILTTTVKVENGELPLVSVRSDKPLPKRMLREAVKTLAKITLQAPVGFHQVIVENFSGTGANILATREIRL